jgi:AcrR family transcriptional regulator
MPRGIMSRESKRLIILDAAAKVFAEKGFQYATMAEIAKGAGISTGLTYSYFKNKLDVLLSIIVNFLQTINQQNAVRLESATDSFEKIYTVFHNFEDLLMQEEGNPYLITVLNEGLPHLVMITDQALQEKRQHIIEQNRKLIHTIDDIIAEGQKKGLFDKTLSPSVMRQVLCGAVERIIYGLFFSACSGEDMGYQREDASKAIEHLINRFISKPGA